MRVSWVASFCSVASHGNLVYIRSNASVDVRVTPFLLTIIKKRRIMSASVCKDTDYCVNPHQYQMV